MPLVSRLSAVDGTAIVGAVQLMLPTGPDVGDAVGVGDGVCVGVGVCVGAGVGLGVCVGLGLGVGAPGD